MFEPFSHVHWRNARDINRYSIFSSMVLHNRENVELVSQILAHKDLDVPSPDLAPLIVFVLLFWGPLLFSTSQPNL